jgi:hypothetical protein
LAAVSILVVSGSLVGTQLVPSVARADQIADLKTRAAQISQKLVADQLEIDAYQQQYAAISGRVSADVAALGRLAGEMALDREKVDSDMRTVRSLAIRSYMIADSQLSGAVGKLFAGNPARAEVVDVYSTLAAGNIQIELGRLHGAQRSLQADQTMVQERQSQDQQNLTEQAAALQAATKTKSELQALQGQVTGQLAAAVSAQAAIEAARAAAAVSAARKAAIAAATSALPGSSLQDPALNPFLQCVVQAESGGNYQAVSPNGMYMGAFQFSQPTWNMAAQAAGLTYLVGVPPNTASKAEQDTVAVTLYSLDGRQPWLGDRCA